MSGFVGLQSRSPDFARALTAAGSIRTNALAQRAQQEELDSAERFRGMLPDVAAGLGSPDGGVRANALARLAGTSQGFATAAPMLLQQARAAQLAAIMGGGAPAAMGGGGAPAGATGQPREWFDILSGQESGGDPNARPVFPRGHPRAGQPRSSAGGLTQFVDGTWMRFAQSNPQLFPNMTREQILAARTNPRLARPATNWYARVNAGQFRETGVPVTAETLALAHQFGAAGARTLLRADPNAPVESVMGPDVITANPELAGRTVGQVIAMRTQRFAGARNVPTLEAPPGATAQDMPFPGAAPIAGGGAAPGAPGMPGAGDAALRARPTGRALPPGMEWAADPRRRAAIQALALEGDEGARQLMTQLQTFLTQDEPLAEIEVNGRRVRVPQSMAVGQEVPLPENTQAELRREFDGLPQVRVFNEVNNAAQNFMRTFGRNTAESDRNLVEAYGRIMAPRTALGPDGTATIVQDQGVLTRVNAMIQSLTGGRRLSADERAAMLAEVQDRYTIAQQEAQFSGQRIARQAEAFRIPLDRVIDFPATLDFSAAPAETTGTPRVGQLGAPAPGSAAAWISDQLTTGSITPERARQLAVAVGLDPNQIAALRGNAP